jgi:shikimate kinase
VARLVLVGMPGAGKSTLARSLADHWRCLVIDTDDALARNVGVPAAQYLREHGEVDYREQELEALRSALTADAVVATGAGIVTTSAARALIHEESTLWLDSDDETLLTRVGEGERPLLGDDHAAALKELRRQREGWYREVARACVDTSGSLDDVLHDVLERVKSFSA